MSKIIITGGTGYIGSHTVVELIQAGYETIILDNLSNSDKRVLDQIYAITGKQPIFYETDICKFTDLEDIFNNHKDISGVIHFAAHKAVGESVLKPLKYYRNNLTSLINLLDLMIKYEVHNLVFSSSCTVYGQPEALPVTEKSPLQKPISPYGNTKQICEEIIEDTVLASTQLSAISLRYFNPIGAHESKLIGELPIGVPTNLMPILTQTATGKRKQFNVYGNKYNTPDGTCIRDYIHVVDLAKAHVAAIQRLELKKPSGTHEIFNIGTGKGYSVLEIINVLEKVSGLKLNYKIVEARPGDSEKIWADNTLAVEQLGWKAEKSVEDMVSSAWNWERTFR